MSTAPVGIKLKTSSGRDFMRGNNGAGHVYGMKRSGVKATAGTHTPSAGNDIYGFTVLTEGTVGNWEMTFVDDGAAITALGFAAFQIGVTYDFHLTELVIPTSAVVIVHEGPSD